MSFHILSYPLRIWYSGHTKYWFLLVLIGERQAIESCTYGDMCLSQCGDGQCGDGLGWLCQTSLHMSRWLCCVCEVWPKVANQSQISCKSIANQLPNSHVGLTIIVIYMRLINHINHRINHGINVSSNTHYCEVRMVLSLIGDHSPMNSIDPACLAGIRPL